MNFPDDWTDDERGRVLIAARLAVLEAAKPLRRYVERLRRAGVMGEFADSYYRMLVDHDRAIHLLDGMIREMSPGMTKKSW